MKYVLYVLLISCLAVSCSRFDSEFELVDPQQDFVEPFTLALGEISTGGVEAVMSFYAGDYLYDGASKGDRRAYFEALQNSGIDYQYEVSLQSFSQIQAHEAVADWILKISVPDTRETILDSTYTQDKLVKRNGKWLLYGNQKSPAGVTDKQMVLIESFTATWCSGCPEVADKLENLSNTYPNRIIYLKYHFQDALDSGNSELYAYYGQSTLPYSVFQGETKVSGSNANALAQYDLNSYHYMNQPARLKLENINYSISGDNLAANLKINTLGTPLMQENLRLRYAIIGSRTVTVAGTPKTYHHVVLSKAYTDLALANLDEVQNFNLDVPDDLPEDASLVVFVQTFMPEFTNQVAIYNALQIPISNGN